MRTEKQKPTAFVIMPFSDDFDEIYKGFLVETLSEAGFEVSRADDIQSAQNILKDIVRGIEKSDLIVADLTDSNPNVFYELGLAHALNKPVIMLSQEIEDLPFDLKSYRVIPYMTHFQEMDRARNDLKGLAAGLLSGEKESGSPVSDFLGKPVESISQGPTEDREAGKVGFLDHLADMEEGFERLTESVTAVGSQTEELGRTANSHTERLKSLQNSSAGASARQMRALVMSLARKLDDYAKFLSAESDKYAPELERTRVSLEEIVRAQDPQAREERERLEGLLSAMDTSEDAAKQALTGISSMTDTLHEISPLERTFNRARDRAVEQLHRLIGNIEQTISMLARAKEIGSEKLGKAPKGID